MAGKGFDGRVFLTKEEHDTYTRRHPVRYAKIKGKQKHTCSICGEIGSKENPLENSHIIPFMKGVIDFWLTPDWLDGEYNLVHAHRKICNGKAEVNKSEIIKHLKENFNIEIPDHVELSMT